jgi:hypothetical protein
MEEYDLLCSLKIDSFGDKSNGEGFLANFNFEGSKLFISILLGALYDIK